MKKLNNKGFSAVEIVAVIIVLAILGFVGYRAYQIYTDKTSNDQMLNSKREKKEESKEEVVKSSYEPPAGWVKHSFKIPGFTVYMPPEYPNPGPGNQIDWDDYNGEETNSKSWEVTFYKNGNKNNFEDSISLYTSRYDKEYDGPGGDVAFLGAKGFSDNGNLTSLFGKVHTDDGVPDAKYSCKKENVTANAILLYCDFPDKDSFTGRVRNHIVEFNLPNSNTEYEGGAIFMSGNYQDPTNTNILRDIAKSINQ